MRIVLELSGNHGGWLDRCRTLIREAIRLRPAMIKFQCFEPYALALKRRDSMAIAAEIGMIEATAEERQHRLQLLYAQTCTPKTWWDDILRELGGYPWSASAFSLEDLQFLKERKCPAYKIASFELQDLELIRACAATKKYLTISVNAAASRDDVDAAVNTAMNAGASILTLLHASSYAHKKVMNHTALQREKDRYLWLCAVAPPYVEVGLSDHSPPNDRWLSDLAIEKDADVIERHLCLPGVKTPDSSFSSTPRQMAKYMQRMGARAYARDKVEAATR